MADSTGNNCHYQNVTIIIRLQLCREIQGMYFYAQCVGQIMNSNWCTFAFSDHNIKNMYFPMDKKKEWLFKNKFN